MRVLIVDDEPLAQTVLANVLSVRRDVGHFDSANDTSEALEKLTTNSYDVLLLDINMPDLSGTQLVGQLRERNLPLPSIVVVTAHVEHAVAAFERHTVDYVRKPFSNESINEALDRAARRAKGERAAKLVEALPQLQQLSCPGRPMIAIIGRPRQDSFCNCGKASINFVAHSPFARRAARFNASLMLSFEKGFST